MTVVAPIGAGTLFGRPVRRVEDRDLLVGRGTYVANLDLPGLLEVAFVRSTVAHGALRAVDLDVARAMPGVVAAWAADDVELPPYRFPVELHPDAVRPALARGRVRFVGDIVAVVVAETAAQAVDAAEAVIVDYDPLPAVVDPEAALEPGAPLQFESIGSNVVAGERSAASGAALADADVVVRGRFENQRIAVVPMEGSALAVVPGGGGGDGFELTVHLSTQFPHMSRGCIAAAFGLDPAAVRVIAPHVGGGFGSKMWVPEHLVTIGVARALGRPVRWVERRSENLVAMAHGRGQVQYVELGLRRDGTITGLRCRVIGDAGAYAGFGGSLAMGATYSMAQGVYRIPAVSYDVVVVTTNTTPTGAYRGAGRPEAAALIERAIDMAADELAIDPAELRRRNFVRPDEFPFATATGVTYDSGDYDAALTEALRIAGYDELLAEQAERRRRDDRVQLGIGMATYVEITGGATGSSEFAEVEVHTDGTATVKVGTSAHGQGHATTFSMLVADRLGLPMEAIRFVQSDTALVPRGGGTGGSRSGQLGGSAVVTAADGLLERAREVAAELLEASPDDVVVMLDGGLGVAGVPARTIDWAHVARAAVETGEPLRVARDFVQPAATFPFGAHVCVVEVDTETGAVTVRRFVAVDDCGRVMNPLIVDGQVHGGVASGIAQALWEQVVVDEDGNPLTTTLAEYAMPSAAELPSIETAHTETPSPLNPLGVKGIGESGSIGSTPATQNAVVDALSHLGVRHVDLPCTAERVWRAITAASAGTPEGVWREPPAVFDALPVRSAGTVRDEVNL